MRKFDYSFLRNGNVPANLINMLTGVYSMKTSDEERKKLYPNIYTALQKIAIVQSVKGSNAIEGICSTDARINAIVNQHSEPLNHNEDEIAGYRDALSLVHNGHDTMAFDETNILRLHEIMLRRGNKQIAGQYKDKDNVIVEVHYDGTRHIRFEPTKASDTPKAMEQLILAYLDASQDYEINPLLLIPCVILDFSCIHPFSDGNGRMSRLLSLLLLYRAGFDAGKYVSFEEQINKHKDMYYEALRRSSIDWQTGANEYYSFIGNFIGTLYDCYYELDKRFAVVQSGKINKQSRIEATVLNSLIPISKSDICNLLPDVSLSTVERVLGQMVKDNKITRIGVNKATRYIRKD